MNKHGNIKYFDFNEFRSYKRNHNWNFNKNRKNHRKDLGLITIEIFLNGIRKERINQIFRFKKK